VSTHNKNLKIGILFLLCAALSIGMPFWVIDFSRNFTEVFKVTTPFILKHLLLLLLPMGLFITVFIIKFIDDLDDAADLIYFLGFLSTLGTIASVLIVDMNDNSKPYVFSFFGLGLILTGVSIILRMSIIRFFGITDPEQDVLDKIDSVSKNLTLFASNIENSIGSFNQAHTQISTTLVSIGQDYENLRTHIKNTTSSIATAMDGLFESIETSFDSIDLDQLKRKIDDFVSSIDQAYPSRTIETVSSSLGVLDGSLKSTSRSLESLELALRENINSIPTRFSTIDFEDTMKNIKKQLSESIEIFASSLRQVKITDHVAREIEESVARFTRDLDIRVPADELKSEIQKIKSSLAELRDIHVDALSTLIAPSDKGIPKTSITKETDNLAFIEGKLSEILVQVSKTTDKYLTDSSNNHPNSSVNLIESARRHAELNDKMLTRLNEISSQLSEINKAIRSFTITDNTDIKIEKKTWFSQFFGPK